jgi:deoxyhypusine synthase
MTKRVRSKFLNRPVEHLDLEKTHSVLEMVESFRHTSFQSRNLFKCFETFRKMLADPRCLIFLGLSGAMIAGGMRKVIRDMIEMRLVDVVVSTGANIFHDLFEGFGFRHYLGKDGGDDDLLRHHRIVRVYDALMDDREINQVIHLLSTVPEEMGGRTVSSREYLEVLGRRLRDNGSILKAASRCGVPVFVPALCDSSIGIGLTFLHAKAEDPSKKVVIDQIRDNFEIAQLKRMASVTGAIYIGGGVPKNYIQQLGPVSELLFHKESGHRYAFQITTDDPKWGGLSGCTFEEAKSWGKIERESSYAAVYSDATIALPLLVGAIMQEGRVLKKRKRRRLEWGPDQLRSIEFV